MLCFLDIVKTVLKEDNLAGPGGAFGDAAGGTEPGGSLNYSQNDNRWVFGFPYIYKRNLNFEGKKKRKKKKKRS